MGGAEKVTVKIFSGTSFQLKRPLPGNGNNTEDKSSDISPVTQNIVRRILHLNFS